jgi:hypothetical protein
VIIMITRARVSGCFGSSAVAGALLVSSALGSAALTGAVLGLLGAVLEPATRALLAVAAAGAVAVGVILRPVPWQLDRETDTAWLTYEDWRTAAYNGFALGLGFTTRIGFWLFYLVPLTAFVVADPAVAALGYAAFAVSRIGRARAIADPLAVAALGALLLIVIPLL